jgi:D-3-phosphoglycerate dehydrogenase
VCGDAGYRCVSGTVFDGTRARLVSVDDCELEIAPQGRLLFIENHDKPGVVASIGEILADANINIGDFRLGRRDDKAEAIALVGIDSEPSDAVMEKLEALESVVTARYVVLEAV